MAKNFLDVLQKKKKVRTDINLTARDFRTVVKGGALGGQTYGDKKKNGLPGIQTHNLHSLNVDLCVAFPIRLIVLPIHTHRLIESLRPIKQLLLTPTSRHPIILSTMM